MDLFVRVMILALALTRGALMLVAAGYVSSFAMILFLRVNVRDGSLSWLPHLWSAGFRLCSGVVVEASSNDPQLIVGTLRVFSDASSSSSCSTMAFSSSSRSLRILLSRRGQLISLEPMDLAVSVHLPVRAEFDRAESAFKFLKSLHRDVKLHRSSCVEHADSISRVLSSDAMPSCLVPPSGGRTELRMLVLRTGSLVYVIHRSWSFVERVRQLLRLRVLDDFEAFGSRQKVLATDVDSVASFVAPYSTMQQSMLGVIMCLVSQYLAQETIICFQRLLRDRA